MHVRIKEADYKQCTSGSMWQNVCSFVPKRLKGRMCAGPDQGSRVRILVRI